MQVKKTYKVAVFDGDVISLRGLCSLVNDLADFKSFAIEGILPTSFIDSRHDLLLYSTSTLSAAFYEQIRYYKKEAAGLPIVVRARSLSFIEEIELVNLGVEAIIDGEIDTQILNKVLVCVVNDGTYYPVRVRQLLQQKIKGMHTSQLIASAFNETQIRILELLSNDLTTDQIAGQLFKSARTIEWHKRNMMDIVGVNSTRQLLLIANDLGIIHSKVSIFFNKGFA